MRKVYSFCKKMDLAKPRLVFIFCILSTRRKDAEGSGIGLYIAKMIVEASGGKLWFESAVGKGTIFYLSIPQTGMLAHEGEKGLAT